MAKLPRDDIRIGEDEWIPFIPLDGRLQDAAPVDEWLQPLAPLFDRLETHCVAGCCGLLAFDFLAESVDAAAKELDCVGLLPQLEAVAVALGQLPQSVVVSQRLNNYIDKTTFLQLLRYLSVRLASAPVGTKTKRT